MPTVNLILVTDCEHEYYKRQQIEMRTIRNVTEVARGSL